jgi:dTDP-L-rhamnose 4-epimerase
VVSRVLVTGGAGFIGSTVVDALAEHEIEPVVLDGLLPAAHGDASRDGPPAFPREDVEMHVGDLRDADLVESCLRGVDAVCHQASMVGLGVDLGDLRAYVEHNDVGTASLLSAMNRSRFRGRIVLASSMVVYGEGGYRCPTHGVVRPAPRAKEDLAAGRFDLPCPRCGEPLAAEPVGEEAPADPRNVYAATKLHQEHLCSSYAREVGASLISLRYHNVYGPRMPRDTPYAGVASIFRSALSAGRSPRVFEDGRQLRDFVHVRDVARANVLALLAGAETRGAFNVASGEPRTVGDMARELANALGPGTSRPVVTGEFRVGDVRHVFASPGHAHDELAFRAKIGFAEGMRELAAAPLREAGRRGLKNDP